MSNEIEKRQDQPLLIPDAGELAAAFDGDKALNVPVGAVLPVVKVLRESPRFEMPDGSIVNNFRGHILYYHSVNQLYLNDYGAENENQRPDCSSFDGLVPCNGYFYRYALSDEEWLEVIRKTDGPAILKDIDSSHPLAQVYLNKLAKNRTSDELANLNLNRPKLENRSEVCSTCPASQFGSRSIADNNKACINYIWLYILIDGYRLPIFMKAGPASLSRKEGLIPFLSNAPNIGLGGMYQTISIQFSLHTKTFNSGFSASSLILSDPRVLDTQDANQLEKLHMLINMYKSFKEKYLAAMQKYVSTDTGEDNQSTADADDGAF